MIVDWKELNRPGLADTNGREGTRPMAIAESRGIWKRFGDRDVVQDVSRDFPYWESSGSKGSPNEMGAS